MEWSWYPELCSLEAFDAHKLSQRLGPRYVLLIGDSLMVQQFAALAAIMRQAVSDATDPQPDWEHFYTMDGGMFQLEGIQFFVGKPIDATVNQSLEVLPGTTWVQMVENAGETTQPGDAQLHYAADMCDHCRHCRSEHWPPLASARRRVQGLEAHAAQRADRHEEQLQGLAHHLPLNHLGAPFVRLHHQPAGQ